MTKLKDVAKLANVSTATVSRVLSNTGKVSDKTKKKVVKAVKELNYRPNVLGRQLRRMETKKILVVVPDITNTFFATVLRGIGSEAIRNGYQVLLVDMKNKVDSYSEYSDYLYHKQVDGVIFLSARIDHDLLNELSAEYPVVLANEYVEGSQIPTVSIDNIKSARKITDHLIGLGHHRIAHISGSMAVILSHDRLEGYQQALRQHGIEVDPVLIQQGNFFYKSGYHLMESLLALANPPTAVFAASDEMAIGAIKAAKSFQLSVPEDIAVVGFDDIRMASIFEPSLTTIAQPAFEMGGKSMELLIRLIAKENIAERQIVLEDEMIIRESCGANDKVNHKLLMK